MSLPHSPPRESFSEPAEPDWHPRFTLLGLIGALTAAAGVFGLLRWNATFTVAWLVSTAALYGALAIVTSHRTVWRRPVWLRIGACALVLLAAGTSTIATAHIDPGLAIVCFFACLIVGVCLAFQLGVGEALLTVFALFLPALLAAAMVGAITAMFFFGPR